MSSAYGSGRSGDTDYRRKWDKQEYAERARAREARDRTSDENEKRRRMGLPPIKAKSEESEDKNLESLRMRDKKIVLDANLGKSQIVSSGASENAKQPGFYCKACDIVCKDSVGFMDHCNGRKHQKNVGFTLKVERVSATDVSERLAMLKRKKEEPKKEYDLDSRIEELTREEEEERRKRKERKRQKKEAKKRKQQSEEPESADGGGGDGEDEMAKMMGFSGFGSSKAE
ncbi:hypothetical protein BCR43DRAFT_521183 [Syncephalastrum racemosum]|uniref:U1-type domain-containing protein n=1 Tax=Syncephalastrum racemosum TaxID=13706 RepID=A0A1X2HL06_SYNRA|nr:hypothetical protein BCR43DRAFT_521183 [Syncephalastrum racemosum]